jgi:hypothetical protein
MLVIAISVPRGWHFKEKQDCLNLGHRKRRKKIRT